MAELELTLCERGICKSANSNGSPLKNCRETLRLMMIDDPELTSDDCPVAVAAGVIEIGFAERDGEF